MVSHQESVALKENRMDLWAGSQANDMPIHSSLLAYLQIYKRERRSSSAKGLHHAPDVCWCMCWSDSSRQDVALQLFDFIPVSFAEF